MLTKIQRFKNKILNSPLLDYWKKECLKDDDIIFGVVAGSTITNICDEKSDLDIQLFTNYTNLYNTNFVAVFEEQHVHGWLHPITVSWSYAPDATNYISLFYAGLYAGKFYTKETIIYQNPHYQDVGPVIQKHQHNFSKLGLYFYFLAHQQRLITAKIRIIKPDGIILDAYYDLYGLEKDEEFHELVLRLKRYKLNIEEQDKVFDIMHTMGDHLQNELKVLSLYKLGTETIINFAEDVEALKNVNI